MSGESSSMPPEAQRPLPKELGIPQSKQELPTGSAAVSAVEDFLGITNVTTDAQAADVTEETIVADNGKAEAIRTAHSFDFPKVWKTIDEVRTFPVGQAAATFAASFYREQGDNRQLAPCIPRVAEHMFWVVSESMRSRNLSPEEIKTLGSFFTSFNGVVTDIKKTSPIDWNKKPDWGYELHLASHVSNLTATCKDLIITNKVLKEPITDLMKTLATGRDPGTQASIRAACQNLNINKEEIFPPKPVSPSLDAI